MRILKVNKNYTLDVKNLNIQLFIYLGIYERNFIEFITYFKNSNLDDKFIFILFIIHFNNIMNIFNPYDLLNVKTTSSLDDIKKSYYELIKLVHPDRGGTKEDTIAIKNAYEYIKKEIENVDYSLTVEILLNRFKEFCNTQETEIPILNDILKESNIEIFNNKFNEKFNENFFSDVYNSGYADLMDNSEISLTYNPNDIIPVKNDFVIDNDDNTNTFSNTDYLTCYSDNDNSITYYYNLDENNNNNNNNSFTKVTPTLIMSDYKESFINNKNIKLESEKVSELQEKSLESFSLESLKIQRDQEISLFLSLRF